MRHDGTRTSGKGAEVHMWTMGRQEMQILYDLCCDALRKTPRTLETQQFRARILNMCKEMGKVLGGKGIRLDNSQIAEPKNETFAKVG